MRRRTIKLQLEEGVVTVDLGPDTVSATIERFDVPRPRPGDGSAAAPKPGKRGRRCCGGVLLVTWLWVRWVGVPDPIRWFSRKREWRGMVAPFDGCGCIYKLMLLWRVLKA